MKTHLLAECNVPRWAIEIFLKLCPQCQKDRAVPEKGLIADGFQKRAQMDLIDFHTKSDRDYYYVFHYQDHLNKFSFLTPLK